MSAEDWNARAQNRRKIARGEKTEPLREARLSILLRESTIDALRSLSWIVDKKGNDRTYDQLIMYLIQSFYKNEGHR
jgi:hypothetical protein